MSHGKSYRIKLKNVVTFLCLFLSEIITGEVQHNDTFSVKLTKKWYRSCMDTGAFSNVVNN